MKRLPCPLDSSMVDSHATVDDDGDDSLQKNNEQSKIELMKCAADSGDASAMVDLGKRYMIGDGVPPDFKKAAELFQCASDLGNAAGIYSLGECYYAGRGVEENGDKAFELFQRASDLGNVDGIRGLGTCYHKGKGDNSSRDHGRSNSARGNNGSYRSYDRAR